MNANRSGHRLRLGAALSLGVLVPSCTQADEASDSHAPGLASDGGSSSTGTGDESGCHDGATEGDESCDEGDDDEQRSLAWTLVHEGPRGRDDCARGIAVDPAGDIVVAGFVHTNSNTDIWVRKLSPDGQEQWTVVHDGPERSSDVAHAVATGPNGSTYVVGAVTVKSDDVRHLDAWVASVSPDGTLVELDIPEGPGGDDLARGVAVVSDGFVVTGEVHVGEGDTDIWVRRYTADGQVQWTRTEGRGGARHGPCRRRRP